MDVPLFIVFLALVLTGAVLVAFVMLTVSIRAEDRRMSMAHPPRTHAEAATRRLLGVHARHRRSTGY